MDKTPQPKKKEDFDMDRLAGGGGVIFSVALLTQMLQLQSLTVALWIALTASVIAMVSGVAALLATNSSHGKEFVTPIRTFFSTSSGIAAVVAAGAAFWHFSWMLGVLFLVFGMGIFIAFVYDFKWHMAMNPDDD